MYGRCRGNWLIVIVALTTWTLVNVTKLPTSKNWGLKKPGWTWSNWWYYWFGRFGRWDYRGVDEHETICQQLWNVEKKVFHEGLHYNISLQNNISVASVHDASQNKLFTFVDLQSLRKSPTYAAFLDLLSNFDPSAVKQRRLVASEAKMRIDVQIFVAELFKTRLFKDLYWFLVRKRYIKSNEGAFKKDLYRIWFSDNNITNQQISAFEKVFVGATVTKPKKISFRNWLQFHRLERHHLNYYGYIKNYAYEPNVLSLMYSWQNGSAVSDNMFIGTSPEFEFSLYTLCFYVDMGRDCGCKINTKHIIIKTIVSQGYTRALENAFFDLVT